MSAHEARFSVLDLVDLPPFEREVWLALSRAGPATIQALSQQIGCNPGEIQQAVAALQHKRRVRPTSDGRWQVSLGRIERHTTLPASLWPLLLATNRIYTEQEIATLKTAIPMLQFARAKLSEFTDHGPQHGLRVKSFATQLSYVVGLTGTERHLLRAAALFHDIGNVVDRGQHNIISQRTVQQLAARGELPFSQKGAELVGLLCRWHRGEYDPERTDVLRNEPVRTGLLAAILRVADAMDIDHRRSDYRGRFRQILEFFFQENLPHWTSLEEILGVRIRCDPAVSLQVFALGPAVGNLQIDMLRGDLRSTPFGWTVVETDVTALAPEAPRPAMTSGGLARSRALLVFPFEPHSLVMTALSRRHLLAAGCTVDLLCYPDTAGGPVWLYQEVLPQISAETVDRLVLIGDRPDETATPHLLSTVRHWRASGVSVSILNRHEANWSRLPSLLGLGAEVVLGGDWAYFWGQGTSEADLAWARIGALCTRDPTQSTAGTTTQERAVTQGLLNEVYEVLAQPPPNHTAGWLAVAEPILDQIGTDDQSQFVCKAGGFREICTGATSAGRLEGRVVVFEEPAGRIPLAYYWIMEAAIEQRGRAPERGLRFNVPYAIASWPGEGSVEVLAISHWREEEAVPIRLLYPSDLGPRPQGNESTIRARMSAEEAAAVIPALTAACNRS